VSTLSSALARFLRTLSLLPLVGSTANRILVGAPTREQEPPFRATTMQERGTAMYDRQALVLLDRWPTGPLSATPSDPVTPTAAATGHAGAVPDWTCCCCFERCPPRSHVSVFSQQRFDRVISLCDRVREVCPEFPGQPETIHWSLPDPAAAAGDDDASYPSFQRTASELETRVGFLIAAFTSRADPAPTTVQEKP